MLEAFTITHLYFLITVTHNFEPAINYQNLTQNSTFKLSTSAGTKLIRQHLSRSCYSGAFVWLTTHGFEQLALHL